MKMYKKQVSQLVKNTGKIMKRRLKIIQRTSNVLNELDQIQQLTSVLPGSQKKNFLLMMNQLVEMNRNMLKADKALYLMAVECVALLNDAKDALNVRKALLFEVSSRTDKSIIDSKDSSIQVIINIFKCKKPEFNT